MAYLLWVELSTKDRPQAHLSEQPEQKRPAQLGALSEKKPGPSSAQTPEPRGQAAPDSVKFSESQRVPPQVGSIRVAMRRITCATCATPPTYSGKACTGDTRRNAHLSATPLTSKGKRLAPPGGDAMQ